MSKVLAALKVLVALVVLATLAFTVVFCIGLYTALDSATKPYGNGNGGIAIEQVQEGNVS